MIHQAKNRRNWPLYALLMREIVGRCTTTELHTRLGISSSTAYAIILRLNAQRLIHIAEWSPAGRGGPVPVWAIGDADNAPRPLTAKGVPSKRGTAKPAPRIEVIAFAKVIKALSLSEPMTQAQIADISGSSAGQIGRFVRFARSLGLIRIGEWDRRDFGGSPAAMYEFAPDQPDVPRPKPMCRLAVVRKYGMAKRARARQLRTLHALAANGPAHQTCAANGFSIFSLAQSA